MYINGGCERCDFSEPDNGYAPVKCSRGYCGGYTPNPVEIGDAFREVYELIEIKTGEKKLFATIEEFNGFYGLNN